MVGAFKPPVMKMHPNLVGVKVNEVCIVLYRYSTAYRAGFVPCASDNITYPISVNAWPSMYQLADYPSRKLIETYRLAYESFTSSTSI